MTGHGDSGRQVIRPQIPAGWGYRGICGGYHYRDPEHVVGGCVLTNRFLMSARPSAICQGALEVELFLQSHEAALRIQKFLGTSRPEREGADSGGFDRRITRSPAQVPMKSDISCPDAMAAIGTFLLFAATARLFGTTTPRDPTVRISAGTNL